MPYRNTENWDKEDQEKDGQNNQYYIFPKDKQEFWNLAEKNGAIILHFVGRFSQQLPYYEHIIRVGKQHKTDYTVTNFIRRSTIKSHRISKLFRDTFIIAVPKGWERALQYKERYLTHEQAFKQNPKKPAKTNKNFSLKQLCQEYKNWKATNDYQEGYKWDFISQFKDTFVQIDSSERFSTQYLKLLSFTENFTPRDMMMSCKFFKDIFIKYHQEHISHLHHLFDEDVPLKKRINDFTQWLDSVRITEKKKHPIHYQVALFFLFVQNPTKYPLATTNRFIRNYFVYTNIPATNKLKGTDLYVFFYQHIHEELLPFLQQELNSQCTVMDAQDFCWFVGKRIYYGYIFPKNNALAYTPREIQALKENPAEEMDYLEAINHTSLTKEEIEKLAHKAGEQPAFSQITQNKLVRDPKIAKLALIEADFHCEVDGSHPSFISRTSKLPYMEAHHLIPTSYSRTFYERYHINLDCKENIISLCPTCHRALHFGTDEKRDEILKILLKKRKEEFRKLGLNMPLSELIKFY